MNDLLNAIKALDRSTRDLHTRFFPDNPPSLGTRQRVLAEELYEWSEAVLLWRHSPLVDYDQEHACKECADLTVTVLGLLHHHGVDRERIATEIDSYLMTTYELGYLTMRQLFRDYTEVITFSDGNILEYFIALACRFIADVIKYMRSENVVDDAIIAAMQAVTVKNDAKTVENGYGVNSAGKIAKVGG